MKDEEDSNNQTSLPRRDGKSPQMYRRRWSLTQRRITTTKGDSTMPTKKIKSNSGLTLVLSDDLGGAV